MAMWMRRLLVVMLLALGTTVFAQGNLYVDPTGSYQFELPEGWRIEEREGYIVVFSPGDEIITLISVEDTTDLLESVRLLWAKYDPEFDAESYTQETTITDPSLLQGFERGMAYIYKDGTGPDGAFVSAGAYILGERTYPSVVITTLGALQRRISQYLVFAQTYRATDAASEETETLETEGWTAEMAAELADFVDYAMPLLETPGLSLAVVYDGEVVMAQGFGQANEQGDPVDADTNMLIASTTKGMTTLLMAQSVDAGLFTWDTPAQEVYPDFAVKDEALSATITMENLVCACSGVPRRDYELILQTPSAEDVLASLRTFEFFTGFGEAFQYSNQLVAAGGFITTYANGLGDDLVAGYAALLDERLFVPLGMDRTVATAQAATAAGNYADPYGQSIEGNQPMSVEDERWVEAIAPAGGVWSNANDMAQYLLMQLNNGIAPDGTRIVSEENLLHTRQPQIAVDAKTQYALGWILTDYNGVPIVTHDGNAFGYTSALFFVPQENFGVFVVANQGYSSAPSLVAGRVLELLYGRESEVETSVETLHANLMKNREALAWRYNRMPDPTSFEAAEGTYFNEALGEVIVSVEDGAISLDFGEYTSPLWLFLTNSDNPEATPEPMEEPVYFTVNAPLSGLPVRLRADDNGAYTLVVGVGAAEYNFVRQ